MLVSFIFRWLGFPGMSNKLAELSTGTPSTPGCCAFVDSVPEGTTDRALRPEHYETKSRFKLEPLTFGVQQLLIAMQQGIVGLSSRIYSEPVLRQWVGKPSLARNLSATGMWEITPEKWAGIRQPHWRRHLDVKRPSRALEELRQVAATRTERRLPGS